MRQSGYYWVKLWGDWVIAKYDFIGNWYAPECLSIFSDKDFEEIDEKQIKRDKS